MGRQEGSPHHNETWPEGTTVNNVAAYATAELSKLLILFVGADQRHDYDSALLHTKALRRVVTRIDQFRRMRVREWRVRQASYRKSSSDEINSQP